MKFIVIALLAVGVTAQTVIEPIAKTTDAAPAPSSTAASTNGGSSSTCEADYIVERCLSTETDKVEACDPTDYDCQCAAYEAVATCYNNCPNDPRAAPAQNQVQVFCQQASLHNTKTTATSSGSKTTSAPTATNDDAEETGSQVSNTATFEAKTPEETGAAGEVFVNAGGALVAVAGAIAALL
ncbi:hypothetical protein NLU13_7546 [Sarocladium strictum]|uniref:GPI anchored serine-threonine rich protein n=1 Tax=Sarocladium strictum TaxID=5046 RepID=A0AA39L5M7_SARSR|nr:hypothetical protein NLU13_7546 [Sarocladium strictum]